MRVGVRNIKKTKIVCEKCGQNLYNHSIWIGAKFSTWKARRTRFFCSNSARLCSDCFVECFNSLAYEVLDAIKHMNFKKVQNTQYLKELAELKHEKRVFNLRKKEIKTENKQTKHKESNSGLDVVGSVL
jgi:ribosomal protein L37E